MGDLELEIASLLGAYRYALKIEGIARRLRRPLGLVEEVVIKLEGESRVRITWHSRRVKLLS